MLMTWSSRERNRSCSPLSRRSRGRIEPSANHVRGQRITAGDSRESPTSICKKIDPGAPISGKSNRWNSCNFYCPSIASGYFTDDSKVDIVADGLDLQVHALVQPAPGLAAAEHAAEGAALDTQAVGAFQRDRRIIGAAAVRVVDAPGPFVLGGLHVDQDFFAVLVGLGIHRIAAEIDAAWLDPDLALFLFRLPHAERRVGRRGGCGCRRGRGGSGLG